jgi:hypothetical protein
MASVRAVKPWRRGLYAACVIALASTARQAGGSTEVEAVGHAGSTAGGWLCGPVARANYAGGAARLRQGQRPRNHRHGGGFALTATGAVEHEALSVVSCDEGEGECPLPPDRLMKGASIEASHHGRLGGATLGLGAYEAWQSAGHRTPALAVYPELELDLRIGPPVRGVIGFGSSVVTTIRRPGAYLGADLLLRPLTLELRAGAHRAGPAVFQTLGMRLDGVAALALSDAFDLRLGASATAAGEHVPPGGELSGGLRLRL